MEKLKDIKCLIAINVAFIIVCIFSCCFIINSKSKKCDCPKCENTCTNCEVLTSDEETGDNTTVEEESNGQVNENKKYTYADVAGHYKYSDDNENHEFYFYENGTVIYYGINEFGPGGYLGSYFIDHGKINASILFEYYNEEGKLYYKPGNAVNGGSHFEILDDNNLKWAGWHIIEKNKNEILNPDDFVEKIANSEIIYGARLHTGEPRS